MVHITQATKPISAKVIQRRWHLIDMEGKVLGREIPNISNLLQGKHKVNYVPYLDAGDHVVIINASKYVLTGKKADQKQYTSFSGYPGGLKEVTFEHMKNKRPEEIVRHAVSGMLPKNKLRDRRLARLHIFETERHTYANQIASSQAKKEDK